MRMAKGTGLTLFSLKSREVSEIICRVAGTEEAEMTKIAERLKLQRWRIACTLS